MDRQAVDDLIAETLHMQGVLLTPETDLVHHFGSPIQLIAAAYDALKAETGVTLYQRDGEGEIIMHEYDEEGAPVANLFPTKMAEIYAKLGVDAG